MGVKDDIETLQWRLRDAEEKLEKLNQHGHTHQWLGEDEMTLTKGLVLWGNEFVTLDGTLQLRCVQAGEDKVAWFKMNDSGDVYLNLPSGTESFVIRNGNINYKIYFRHDGTNALITALTGKMILRSDDGGDIDFGLASDTQRITRETTHIPSLYTSVFDVAATNTSSTLNTWTNITGVSGSLTTKGGNLWVWWGGGIYRQTNAGSLKVRLFLDHATGTDYYVPNSTGVTLNSGTESNEHVYFFYAQKVTGVAAGTYTVTGQVHDNNSALVTSDGNDRWTCVVGED